jgi:hypothetical protein
MIDYVLGDVLEHALIYIIITIFSTLTIHHVFFACMSTRKEHKDLLAAAKKDRQEMEQLVGKLKQFDKKCPALN